MMFVTDWLPVSTFSIIFVALFRLSRAHRLADVETHISNYGWQRYIDFAKSTCRLDDDVYSKIHLDDPYYGYWNWEEAEFIKALRLKLIPETEAGDYSSIVKENRLGIIDRRLLAAELPSFCTNENKSDEEILSESDKIIREHNAFEDVLINTIFNLGGRYR